MCEYRVCILNTYIILSGFRNTRITLIGLCNFDDLMIVTI